MNLIRIKFGTSVVLVDTYVLFFIMEDGCSYIEYAIVVQMVDNFEYGT